LKVEAEAVAALVGLAEEVPAGAERTFEKIGTRY
jgi:hypothetical protein